MHCPQCHEPIEATVTTSYAVSWCEHDVHVACLPLHVRSCRVCWPYNTAYILTQDQQAGAVKVARQVKR